MTIDKKQFIHQVAYHSHAKIQDTKKILNGMIRALYLDLQQHNKVKLRGLGNFKNKHYRQRAFHDITTNKKRVLPAHNVPTFYATNKFRNFIN